MWLNLPFAQVSRSVERNVHTNLSFPNPLSESEELVLGMFKYSAILDAIWRSFFPNQWQQQCLVRLDFGHPPLSSSSTSSIPSRNREYHLIIYDRFRTSLPQAFCTNTSVCVADRPSLNKIVWQLSVHFHQPWRIRKTDFTWQVITRTLSKTNKQNLVCERMLVDSVQLVGWPIEHASLLLKKNQS